MQYLPLLHGIADKMARAFGLAALDDYGLRAIGKHLDLTPEENFTEDALLIMGINTSSEDVMVREADFPLEVSITKMRFDLGPRSELPSTMYESARFRIQQPEAFPYAGPPTDEGLTGYAAALWQTDPANIRIVHAPGQRMHPPVK